MIPGNPGTGGSERVVGDRPHPATASRTPGHAAPAGASPTATGPGPGRDRAGPGPGRGRAASAPERRFRIERRQVDSPSRGDLPCRKAPDEAFQCARRSGTVALVTEGQSCPSMVHGRQQRPRSTTTRPFTHDRPAQSPLQRRPIRRKPSGRHLPRRVFRGSRDPGRQFPVDWSLCLGISKCAVPVP